MIQKCVQRRLEAFSIWTCLLHFNCLSLFDVGTSKLEIL